MVGSGGGYTDEAREKMVELLASLRTAVPAAERPISVGGCEGRPERPRLN